MVERTFTELACCLITHRRLRTLCWPSRTSGVSETLKAIADEFERRHGFPQGVNEVRLADHADQAAGRTLAQVSLVPADLVTFYDSIGEATWADVGNGYFVDPASSCQILWIWSTRPGVSWFRTESGLTGWCSPAVWRMSC
ncbi:hypothetical protein GCM10010503_40160 [Streptomyces lucensis JCM 4490]|uniref:Uncharacterized protein n=1 Tax=Streptomyces lucensis JCM 4490 TaxID=1306176 RepID=A0A918JBR6_9ACTN|nr:hypothetical protein [Streptomyces lucensis]GGW59002.1 hypothetical protein GCM10010503_40160 [Streptomyces lucensis JCM 4490]